MACFKIDTICFQQNNLKVWPSASRLKIFVENTGISDLSYTE